MNDDATIKQALREAIESRQRDLERFVIELKRIEKREREAEQAMLDSMQARP